jgi:myo-inositol 2-dehydrogenase / D-chiro-inositol 1-dehydrogenase
MTVRVGVIGVGMIGQDHIRRITQVLTGGTVVAVNDVDQARAEQVAAALPGAVAYPTAAALIGADHVDAVLVASWGPAHEEQVVAAIKAGKPVFCEKPLSPDSDACLRIIDAELAAGRRYVQVGFMRRYDASYLAMKAALDDGSIGAPVLMHCAHRNPSAPPYGFTTEMIVSDSAVHEMDLVRWLFGAEIVAVSTLTPRRTGQAAEGVQDPLIILFELASGVLVDDEVFLNAGYGYDIRGEVVGESGAVALADDGGVTLSTAGRRTAIPAGRTQSPQEPQYPHGPAQTGRVPADWRERFSHAYAAELQDWLNAVAAETVTGPSSWDGYAAAAVTDSALRALHTGQRIAVSLPERPGFYAKTQCGRTPDDFTPPIPAGC